MSPGDVGELVKPFVFLDYFEFPNAVKPGLPVHPHSGIATHTTLLQGSVDYADSTGKSGTLSPRSIEWMQAGGGVWHGGGPSGGESLRGFQLSRGYATVARAVSASVSVDHLGVAGLAGRV